MATIEIRNTQNEVIAEVDEGKIDTSSTSITLFGRGTESYLAEFD